MERLFQAWLQKISQADRIVEPEAPEEIAA